MNVFQEMQERAAESQRPKPKFVVGETSTKTGGVVLGEGSKPLTDADRDYIVGLVETKLFIITNIGSDRVPRATEPIPAEDRPTIKARLKVCRDCDKLAKDGCTDCQTCSSRFVATLKRVASGTCVRFDGHPDARYQPPVDAEGVQIQPQRKVNEMLVYVYSATYTTPDAPNQKKGLRVVASGLKDLLATIERMEPGATVIGAPAGQPIDAIADGIIPSEIERSQKMTTPSQQAQQLIATPQGMMTPEQIAAMAQQQG